MGKPRKAWKEVVDKDVNDLHQVLLWIVVNGGK